MKLFEPGTIGRLTIKNRIAMAPMSIGGLIEPDGRLSQRAVDYFVTRAKGGVGLIITNFTRTNRLEQSPHTPFVTQTMLDGQWYLSRLTELADAVHDYRAKICIQASAGFGRTVGAPVFKAGLAVGPSVLPAFWVPGYFTRELTTQEVEQLAQSFQPAAEMVAASGIDAIELHGHEGYLFDEFMTSLWNKRTDKYGGELQNRVRLATEAIAACKRGAGKDFPVIYRYGLTHFLPGGREVEEGLEIARLLEAAGVDAIDIDGGCYETWYWAHPPTTSKPGPLIHLAEMLKKAVKIPVITAGKLGFPDLAESVLQEGKADFISLGRTLVADPEWPNKVKAGKLDDIRPCIGDHECLKRAIERKYISCMVNPCVGMEREFTLTPAVKQKSVLVIGGGPGGMEAARVSALRGHKVTLWEKGNALGGNLIPASLPTFKVDYKRLLTYLSTQIKKLGVTVELNREATPEMVLKMKPDVVFIATGGSPIIPSIPGVDSANVATAIDLLLGKKKAGSLVVMIGGDAIGCETALHLAQQGKQVTVVHRMDGAATDCFPANRLHLLKLLSEANVKILTSVNVKAITAEGVTITDKDGAESKLKADTVGVSMGIKPLDNTWAALEGKIPEVYTIGDFVQARKIMGAIWDGFRTARLI